MWQTKEISQIFKELKTSYKGLNENEVKQRLEKYGKNTLKEKKKESIFIKFIKQFNDFMIITLIIAAIISAVVSKMNGESDYIDSIIIIAIVIFNAIMGLVQEQKAEKIDRSIKENDSPSCKGYKKWKSARSKKHQK